MHEETRQRIHGLWCSASTSAMSPEESRILSDRVQLLTDELVLSGGVLSTLRFMVILADITLRLDKLESHMAGHVHLSSDACSFCPGLRRLKLRDSQPVQKELL
jgi:hypothetical protein